MLAQRLVVRAEHAGVLAQTPALAPDLGGPPRPPGSPLAQPTAAREHTLGAREVGEAAAGQYCRSHVIRPSRGHVLYCTTKTHGQVYRSEQHATSFLFLNNPVYVT